MIRKKPALGLDPRVEAGCSLPVYNWFTEGFDALDLKEAKALHA